MRSQSGLRLAQSYTDALEAALGGIVARAHAELAAVGERIDARLAECELRLCERLATVRDGRDGIDGRDGVDGAAGKDGKHGERGERGPAGEFPLVVAWLERVHYAGEVVTHYGATWQAVRDTGREPPRTEAIEAADRDWICLASGGRNGRSFAVRGTFDEAERYSELDVVALNGASFAARRDAPGPCPGDGWQLIAGQGKAGRPGERGVGIKGDRGMPGPSVVALTVDGEGLLTLTSADGSVATCDLYPLLSQLRG